MPEVFHIEIDEIEGADLLAEVKNRFGQYGCVEGNEPLPVVHKTVRIAVKAERRNDFIERLAECVDTHTMTDTYINDFLNQHGLLHVIRAARDWQVV